MIGTGKVVELHYVLTDAKGKVLDRADKDAPFSYLHGGQQIVPGLESALIGLKVGDKKKVVVPPADGYGDVSNELRIEVKRSQFPPTAELQQGMQFQANGPEGQGMVFTVSKVEGDTVHIDGNHPLAGETLHFDVEVTAVRDATDEEKEHGHAHGPDGHGHHH
ncbi:MAG: peptidylprolyl isomerase [Bdellovibrionota bacterium]